MALTYIMLHAFLFFVNVASLNVAFNSADSALLTLLISSNFAEIKTSVFKKFDVNNLFQVASSDVTERFKLCVFVSRLVFFFSSSWCSGGAGCKHEPRGRQKLTVRPKPLALRSRSN